MLSVLTKETLSAILLYNVAVSGVRRDSFSISSDGPVCHAFSGGNGVFPGGNGMFSGGNGAFPGGNGMFSGGNETFSGGNGVFSGGNGVFSGGNETSVSMVSCGIL
ncbi:MAG: hypothetical protein LBD79_07790 [Treponema sp.]|nr:hypothetical protein [Treponema sp.]